jgi:hypothetical protein
MLLKTLVPVGGGLALLLLLARRKRPQGHPESLEGAPGATMVDPSRPLSYVKSLTAARHTSVDGTWRNGVSTVPDFPAVFLDSGNPQLRPGDVLAWSDGTTRTVQAQHQSAAGVGAFDVILNALVDPDRHGYPKPFSVMR